MLGIVTHISCVCVLCIQLKFTEGMPVSVTGLKK